MSDNLQDRMRAARAIGASSEPPSSPLALICGTVKDIVLSVCVMVLGLVLVLFMTPVGWISMMALALLIWIARA